MIITTMIMTIIIDHSKFCNMSIYNLIAVLLLAIALPGCSGNSNHSAKEGHGHAHDEKLLLTSYNNELELFAEITPFVVGEQGDILAHFSSLADFKPLREGKVTVNLIVGTDGIRQTLEKPAKSGIYRFSLKPGVAGNGKLLFDIVTPEGTSHIIIPDVRVYTDVHDAQHAAAEAEITTSNGVVFTKEQSWKVDFATTEITAEPFGQIIRTTAQILPSQGDERVVIAKTNGIVLFPGDQVVNGKAVQAGHTLFAIEGSDLADNNIGVRYREAESEYNKTKAEYERKKGLVKEGVVSEREWLDVQTAYTNAKAVYDNLRNFSAGRQSVSAPINGFVTQVLVRNGEYVEAGQPVMVVSQNRDLLIKAELQPKYFGVLGGIVSANIRVLDRSQTYTLEELEGKVVSFGKSVDVNNPLIPVVFQVKNNTGLLSGSFVEMYIKTQTINRAIAVPNESIVEEMGNYFVFVQLTPELFEKRTIRKGATDGFRTEVTEGLAAHERVVSKGAILVKLAQSAGALDAHSGHVH